MSDGLGIGTYLLGSLSFAALAAVLAWGAWRLRRALLPTWSGALARLAEVVMVLAAAIGVAQLLGAFGAFSRGWVAAGCVVAGAAMGVAGIRVAASAWGARLAGAAGDDDPPVAGPSPRAVRVQGVALVASAGIVAAQWATHVADAFSRGMSHPDTLWYHASYAGYLLQTGDFTELPDRTDVIQAFYPLNATVVHALVDLPFRADVLAPLVNIGWAALALLAAYCIGARLRAGVLAVLGAVAVLGLPMLAGTQPGQASNDVAVGALLLAAVALVLAGRLAVVPTSLAGVAAGLAIGTKLTVVVPVAVLAIGVVVITVRARRWASAAGWTAGLSVFGAFWYVRNWVVVDNPLPWFELELGPLSLPQSAEEQGRSLVGNITDGETWRLLYLPGLTRALGRVWPIVIIAALAVGVVLVVRGRVALERVVGALIIGGFVAYVITPSSGGLNFAFNVRYLSPVLFVAFAALPRVLAHRIPHWREVAAVALVGLVIVDATVQHHERIEAWPTEYLAVAVLTGVATVAAALLLWRWRHRRLRPSAMAVVAVGVFLFALVVGWPLQRRYLEDRYVDAQLDIDRINTALRDVEDRDVAVFGTIETYPMLGLDLSNRVVVRQGPSTGFDVDPCREWPDVRAGDYDYIVLTQIGALVRVSPPDDWFDDPAVTELVREGDSVLYRVDGPLDPPACADS